jgi:hypothetical protein
VLGVSWDRVRRMIDRGEIHEEPTQIAIVSGRRLNRQTQHEPRVVALVMENGEPYGFNTLLADT